MNSSRSIYIMLILLFTLSYLNFVVTIETLRLTNETYKTTNYVFGLVDLVNTNVVVAGTDCRGR